MSRQEQGAERDVQLPIRLSSHNNHVGQAGVTKAELGAPCARWSDVLPDGNYQLDLSKIQCLLSQDERDDRLLVRNVIHGTILSSQIYPLIFDTKEEVEEQMVRLRSLCYFTQLLADREKGALTYQSLDHDQKAIVAVGVRDLFLAASRGLLNDHETDILHGMTELLDETLGCVEVMSMNVSFHPSANFTVMKLMELEDDEALGPSWSPLFARVMDVPRLVAVFVDPAELSYHNMENIIPLDRWLESKMSPENGALSASLEDTCQVQAEREVWTCKLKGTAVCDLLKQLAALDNLYTSPPNKASRGGERFIFHSASLSKALTEAVTKSDLLQGESKLAQGQLESSFEFVNYVFRCNKFAAGDSAFVNHRDTPYCDGEHQHVSKYTFLIYLTKGQGDPALQVQDVDLKTIDEEMTCVIFDQRYEHEGKPFLDNEKIFIRSDLVFKDTEMEHNSDVSSLFSEACYMTRHGLLNKELESYAQDCFERVNAFHWALEREATQPPIYLRKQFRGNQFLTNGYNYWFPKDSNGSSSPSGTTVVDCAVIAVLDYFNCKVNGKPFNSLCGDPIIVQDQFKTTKDVWEHMRRNKSDTKAIPLKRLESRDIESLIYKGPDGKALEVFPDECYDTSDEESENEEDEDENRGSDAGESDYFTCCPDCYDGERNEPFDAWRSPLVRRSYRKSWKFVRAALQEVPLLVFGEELVVNESSVKVDGDKILFLRGPDSKPRPRVNFAGCWDTHVRPPEFITTDKIIGAMNLQVPPILWHEFEEGYQLTLDLFRNDWIDTSTAEMKIPVPMITNDANYRGDLVHVDRLVPLYHSGEFRHLFDILSLQLDSSSLNTLVDEWYYIQNKDRLEL